MPVFRLPDSERPIWYHILLGTLLLLHVARPAADYLVGGDMFLAAMGVVLLVACLMAMGRARASRFLAWLVLVPAVALTLSSRDRSSEPHVIGQLLSAFIMCMVCGRILERIFRTRDVTWATISGGIAVYLLISAIWTPLYSIAAWSTALEPAFNGIPPASELLAAEDLEHTRTEVDSTLSYFGLVTLTTLGYGDISPAHPITRALATGQALVGQLYLVVLIARLVSMHAQATRPD